MAKRLFAMLLLCALLFGCTQELPAATVPCTTAAPTTQPTEESFDPLPEEDDWEDGPNVERSRFTAGDFGYVDGYLTCLAEPCLMGLDVSSYQPEIDWEQVRDAGFSFVMIRIGGRGYGEAGNLFADTMANAHYKGAKAAGLKVGAYFFSQAIDTDEALEEARFVLKLLEGWELDLPVAYDWEYISPEARTAFTDQYMVAKCSVTFCEAMKEAGFAPMIYFALWHGYPYLEFIMEYPVWIALYTDEMDYQYRFDMWQYTSSGDVPGVDGDVDLNIYFPPEMQ